MFINTKFRSDQVEIMDNFSVKGEVLFDALDKIAKINQLLGGNELTIRGVQDLIATIPQSIEITIVDIGCGNGNMLRALADFGIKNNLKFQLIGIDANEFTINHAKKLSVDYPNIRYQFEDVFDKYFEELNYDIVLCTLTLHHFKDEEIIQLMSIFKYQARIGIVINDLHRSWMAYYLFKILCFAFQLSDMPRKDGLTSILRGFKKEELVNFSKKLNFNKYKIQWKWAFRYQWIISNI